MCLSYYSDTISSCRISNTIEFTSIHAGCPDQTLRTDLNVNDCNNLSVAAVDSFQLNKNYLTRGYYNTSASRTGSTHFVLKIVMYTCRSHWVCQGFTNRMTPYMTMT